MKKTFLFSAILLCTASIYSQWETKYSDAHQFYNCIYFLDNKTGWAGGYDDAGNRFILRTTDGGENWNKTSIAGTPGQLQFLDESNGFCTAPFSYHSGDLWLHSTYRTTDGGLSWENLYHDNYLTAEFIKFFDENNGMILLKDSEKALWIFRTEDGGANWIKTKTQFNFFRPKLQFTSDAWFLSSTESNELWKSTDQGKTWNICLTATGPIGGISFSNDLEWYAVASDKLYYTKDGGSSWQQKSFDNIYVLDGVQSLNDKVWLIENRLNKSYLLYSSDAGETWTPIPYDEGLRIHSLYLVDNDVWTTAASSSISNGIYNGVIKTNSGEISVVSPAVPELEYPANNSTVSSNNFTWKSDDPAFYHLQVSTNEDFSDVVVDQLLLEKNYNANLETEKTYYWRLRAENAAGNSDWSETRQFNLSILTGINDENTPLSFELFQNYPNPFNPETRIKFSLPSSGHVVLKIYNVQAEEVAEIINETKDAGSYNIVWNAQDLPSGIYFCRMNFNGSSLIQKMILMK